jgi:hypothetical protein
MLTFRHDFVEERRMFVGPGDLDIVPRETCGVEFDELDFPDVLPVLFDGFLEDYCVVRYLADFTVALLMH